LGFDLLQGSTKVHLNHLLVTGDKSFAAHKAMNEFYDGVADLADDYIEQYQGATETLMEFPKSYEFPVMKTANDCLVYLRQLYTKVNLVQSKCTYSEINNTLDEVKSLINSTKYKLIFLG
jgi:hypothetical protein